MCFFSRFFSGFVDCFYLTIVGKQKFGLVLLLYLLFCQLSRCTAPLLSALLSLTVMIDCLIGILLVMLAAFLDCTAVVFYFWMTTCSIMLPLGVVVLALMTM